MQKEFLKTYIREQIELEKSLYNLLEDKVADEKIIDLVDAKILLGNIIAILERRFAMLNQTLENFIEKELELKGLEAQ